MPLCETHTPSAERRCDDCELEYESGYSELLKAEWKMSQGRESFIILASLVLKVAMVAILMALLLIALGAMTGATEWLAGAVLWVVALMATRRLAEGPNFKGRARRARRRFLRERLRQLPLLGVTPDSQTP